MYTLHINKRGRREEVAEEEDGENLSEGSAQSKESSNRGQGRSA